MHMTVWCGSHDASEDDSRRAPKPLGGDGTGVRHPQQTNTDKRRWCYVSPDDSDDKRNKKAIYRALKEYTQKGWFNDLLEGNNFSLERLFVNYIE